MPLSLVSCLVTWLWGFFCAKPCFLPCYMVKSEKRVLDIFVFVPNLISCFCFSHRFSFSNLGLSTFHKNSSSSVVWFLWKWLPVMQSPPAQWPLSSPCVDFQQPPRLVPNSPDVLNLVMISAAHSNIRMVNDCYYMLKEFPLVGFLFGSLPGLLSMVTMAKQC